MNTHIKISLSWLILTGIMLLFFSGCTNQPVTGDSSKLSQEQDRQFVQRVINAEKQFKQKGQWREHIQEGEKALAIARRQKDEKAVMTLSIQLASSWFYLGNTGACLKAAEDAQHLAIKQGDRHAQIQSLYLISAAQRSQNSPESVQTARQALALYDRLWPEDFGLKAKVLYNLAAAESDVEPRDLVSAEQHLQQAAINYRKAGIAYEQLRVNRRLAEVQYRRGHYQQAEQTLLSTNQKKTPREALIYEYQLAKVQHHLQQWEKAHKTATQALEKAAKLDAQTEITRLKALIHAIEQKTFMD